MSGTVLRICCHPERGLRDPGRAESRDLQFENLRLLHRSGLEKVGLSSLPSVLPHSSCNSRSLTCDTLCLGYSPRLNFLFSALSMRLLLDHGKAIDFHGPADITKETTDAIVNAANSSLMGGGGVDGAIHRAGGPAILAECKNIVAEIGRLPAGKAVITTGGRLTAKYVIHTVGPVYSNGKRGEAETLASCHRECIQVADEHGLESLSFPAISTGAYGYPVDDAAQVAISAVLEALPSTTHMATVRFVLFDSDTLRAYATAAEQLHKRGVRMEKST